MEGDNNSLVSTLLSLQCTGLSSRPCLHSR